MYCHERGWRREARTDPQEFGKGGRLCSEPQKVGGALSKGPATCIMLKIVGALAIRMHVALPHGLLETAGSAPSVESSRYNGMLYTERHNLRKTVQKRGRAAHGSSQAIQPS